MAVLVSDLMLERVPSELDPDVCSAPYLAYTPDQRKDLDIDATYRMCHDFKKFDAPYEFSFYPLSSPNVGLVGRSSQCFAASANQDRTTASDPSGIYCSSQDFRSLYSRNCSVPDGNGACCKGTRYTQNEDNTNFNGIYCKDGWCPQMVYSCTIDLAPSLKQQHRDALAPSADITYGIQKSGIGMAACGWHGDFWVNSEDDCYPLDGCSIQWLRWEGCGIGRSAANMYQREVCTGHSMSTRSNQDPLFVTDTSDLNCK